MDRFGINMRTIHLYELKSPNNIIPFYELKSSNHIIPFLRV